MTGLSAAQQAVVDATFTGLAAVPATAGAGKTHTALARAERLVEVGLRVVFVAFSRAAQTALTDRLQAMGLSCEVVGMSGLRNRAYLALYPGAELATFGAVRVVCASVLDEIDATGRIAALRGARLTHDLIAETANDGKGVLTAEVRDMIFQRLQATGRYVYAMTTWEAHRNPAVVAYMAGTLAGQADEVIMDECQDADGIELAVMAGVAERGANGLCIGDPQQSIYGFRGAFGDFIGHLGITAVLPLNETFRIGKTAGASIAALCEGLSLISDVTFTAPGCVIDGGYEPMALVFDTPDAVINHASYLALSFLGAVRPQDGGLVDGFQALCDELVDRLGPDARIAIAFTRNEHLDIASRATTGWLADMGVRDAFPVEIIRPGSDGAGRLTYVAAAMLDPARRVGEHAGNPAHVVAEVIGRSLWSVHPGASREETRLCSDLRVAVVNGCEPGISPAQAITFGERRLAAVANDHNCSHALRYWAHSAAATLAEWRDAWEVGDAAGIVELAGAITGAPDGLVNVLADTVSEQRVPGTLAIARQRIEAFDRHDEPEEHRGEARVLLCGLMQTKGLEFDAIVIVSGSPQDFPHRRAQETVADALADPARARDEGYRVFTWVTRAKQQVIWLVVEGAEYFAEVHTGREP